MPTTERLSAALLIGILTGLVIWVSGVTLRQSRDLDWYQARTRTLDALVQELRIARDTALARPPVVEVRTIEKIVRPDCGHAVPVFAARSCWGQ